MKTSRRAPSLKCTYKVVTIPVIMQMSRDTRNKITARSFIADVFALFKKWFQKAQHKPVTKSNINKENIAKQE